MRIWLTVIGLVAVLCSASSAEARALNPILTLPVQSQIQETVDGKRKNQAIKVNGEKLAASQQIREFYGRRDFQPAEINNIWDFTKQLFMTMWEAHDKQHVDEFDFLRTIAISTSGVRTTDFHLTDSLRDKVYGSGKQAAREFLKTWSHARYIREARTPQGAKQIAKVKRWRQRVNKAASPMVGIKRGV